MPEPWRYVFREGVCPLVSDEALGRLRQALRGNSPEVLQGQTTEPIPAQEVQDFEVRASCPIAYLVWKGQNRRTVEEVEEAFYRLVSQVDQLLGEPASCRGLLHWIDGEPRPVVWAGLLSEIDRELARRDARNQARFRAGPDARTPA